MADTDVTLRYGGGGSLTFADASGARHLVRKGEPFRTDAATACVLLLDPDVTLAGGAPREREAADPGPEAAPPEATLAQLRERASGLGLTLRPRARKADLVAAIAEHEATTTEGGTMPADDPDALSSGEAGPPLRLDEEGDPLPPPAPSSAGTITLGDLPPGARRPPSQGQGG